MFLFSYHYLLRRARLVLRQAPVFLFTPNLHLRLRRVDFFARLVFKHLPVLLLTPNLQLRFAILLFLCWARRNYLADLFTG